MHYRGLYFKYVYLAAVDVGCLLDRPTSFLPGHFYGNEIHRVGRADSSREKFIHRASRGAIVPEPADGDEKKKKRMLSRQRCIYAHVHVNYTQYRTHPRLGFACACTR